MVNFSAPLRQLSFCSLLLALIAAPLAAESAESKSMRELDHGNQSLLASPWTTLLPGQPGGNGFSLSKNGQLSFQSNPIKPLIRLYNGEGKNKLAPISVNLAPLSPSKRYTLMTACEPPDGGNSLCWFQYQLDLKQSRMDESAWAKYPLPTAVWWEPHERYVALPVTDEGEVWLSVLDLGKKESRDVHFDELAQEVARSQNCTLPEQEGYTIDLTSVSWMADLQLAVNLVIACNGEKTTRTVKTSLNVQNGQLQRVAESPGSGKSGSDKGKAATDKSK
ncbi:MAG: hypothetical protein HQM06_03460 [Magnetococcales bacterium]|nr:hypothetical protein [Magnetococcales bacterium]